jgi:hypothetical protein
VSPHPYLEASAATVAGTVTSAAACGPQIHPAESLFTGFENIAVEASQAVAASAVVEGSVLSG